MLLLVAFVHVQPQNIRKALVGLADYTIRPCADIGEGGFQ